MRFSILKDGFDSRRAHQFFLESEANLEKLSATEPHSGEWAPSCFALKRFAGLDTSLIREAGLPSEARGRRRADGVHYVYLLESLRIEGQRYVGVTSDLKQRLGDHNSGYSVHTAKYRPWKVVTYIAFSDRLKAEAFEHYLKSGSGHAFAKRRLW